MISVILPAFNEQESLEKAVVSARNALISLKQKFEIIIVNDGSFDSTQKIAQGLCRKFKDVFLISYEINRGKSYALNLGFARARGEYIVMLDSDNQFDPLEIKKFTDKLDEGFDVVNGWGDKKEPFEKRFFSKIYNIISRMLFGISVHQYNLGFKAFKKEVVKGIELKKDEHRYLLPVLKHWKNAKIAEVRVKYLERSAGVSKYGKGRIIAGFLDLIAIKLRLKFEDKPMRFFGLLGILSIALGLLIGAYLTILWIFFSREFSDHFTLFITCIFLIMVGIQFFSTGFLAELIPKKED